MLDALPSVIPCETCKTLTANRLFSTFAVRSLLPENDVRTAPQVESGTTSFTHCSFQGGSVAFDVGKGHNVTISNSEIDGEAIFRNGSKGELDSNAFTGQRMLTVEDGASVKATGNVHKPGRPRE